MIDGLDLHLEPGELALLERCVSLGRDVFDQVAKRGTDGHVNHELLGALAQHGLLARLFSYEDGRWEGNVSAMDLCLIREGLARHCPEAETAFALQGLGSYPMLRFGRPEVVDPWVARLARGEVAAGFALTEPDAGSDVASITLQARRDRDGYRLTGEKVWISNAPDASVYSVFARTTEGAGARGLTAFIVPRDCDGFRGERLSLIAPHPIGRLIFEDAFVPAEFVLGCVNAGFGVAMETLDLFRPSVGAFAIGMAQTALAATVERVAQRRSRGGHLKDHQAIAHRLAELATRVAAARLLVHQAARLHDSGVRPVAHLAAMAKLLATEVAQGAVDAAVQFHGACGLERGHVVEHLYREVRAPRIYEGASEIQREIIARHIFRSTELSTHADFSGKAPPVTRRRSSPPWGA